MNLYGYCGNGPVSFIDPTGLGPQPGQDWGRNLSNLIAGVGYGMSFGLIQPLWHQMGTDAYIDHTSPYFRAGKVAGFIHGVATAAVSLGPRLVGWAGARSALFVAGAAGVERVVEENEGDISLGLDEYLPQFSEATGGRPY